MAESRQRKNAAVEDRITGDLYSIREVSRIFNISESKLRYWAQTGFLNPSLRKGARSYYSFSDLIGVKTAQDLSEKGLSLQKVRKNLSELRKLLPEEQKPLSRLRIRSDGEQLVVMGEEAVFEVETRQTLLDFHTESLRENILLAVGRPVKNGAGVSKPCGSAYQWFIRGLAFARQSEKQAEAADAFRRALKGDPCMAAAHTNLGNIYYKSGRPNEAAQHYKKALALDPDQPEALYNLANIHEEEGNTELSIAEYLRVIGSNPDFPDPYFNLGLAFEKTGNREQAIECFRKYLAFDSDSDGVWAKLAREHIKYMEKG